MNFDLTVYRLEQFLKTPYRLSFATVKTFQTLVLVIKGPGESLGIGEITPLPGYSEETIQSATQAVSDFCDLLNSGTEWDVALSGIAENNPMVVSGLVCARETLAEWPDLFAKPACQRPIPLAALCDGSDLAEIKSCARTLVAAGYRHFKMKAGMGPVKTDIARIQAAALAAGGDVDISVDANQGLPYNDAVLLCDAMSELPVRLVEQPFPPQAWDEFAALAGVSRVPLMLDESIWTAQDIQKAKSVGAAHVKLKLCKHPGIAATFDLLEVARQEGLGVVFGNGVQGAIGNHIEAMIYDRAGIESPAEINGILKLCDDVFAGDFSVKDGFLHSGGLQLPRFEAPAPLAHAAFTE